MGVTDGSPIADLLSGLAAQLCGVQELRIGLRTRADAVAWHSPAAGAFADVLQQLLGQLRRGENHLDDLSAAVQRHYRLAQRREHELASVAGAVTSTVQTVRNLL